MAALAFTVVASMSTASYAAAKEAHPEGAAEGKAGGHHEEHPEGVPLDFKADLVVWSIVVFVIFLVVLKSVAWGQLNAGLQSREEGIRRDIADAEAARKSAQTMLAEHERKLAKVHDEMKAMLDEARRDAESTRQGILADAAKEAAATRSRALAEIEQAKNHALDQLFDAMSDRVVAATEHVIGRTLNDGDQSRLVSEALAQVSPKA